MEGNDSFHNGVTINFIYYYGKLVYQNVNLRSYFRSPPTTKVSLGRCVILHFSKRTFIHSFFFFTLNIHLSFEIDLERYWGSKEVVRIGLVAMVDLVVVISGFTHSHSYWHVDPCSTSIKYVFWQIRSLSPSYFFLR
jgi:hypothetical protein